MTVVELKKVIRKRTNEPIKNQQLFFNGNEMKSQDSILSSYGIENVVGVTHKIQLKNPDKTTKDTFQIIVECTDGKTLSLSVRSKMTVFELKKVIRNRINEPIKNQKLYFNGKVMKSQDSTLSSYDIENVPGITHKIKMVNEATDDTFQIIVENTDGTTYNLPVHSKMTVFELKKVLRSRINEPVKNQKLYFNGKDMKSHDLTLSSYGIENIPGITHKIQLKDPDKTTKDTFQITVENTDGTTYSLSVRSKMTVFELKKVIRSRINEPVKNQQLLFNGKNMKSHNSTLSSYGIENVLGVTHKIQLKDSDKTTNDTFLITVENTDGTTYNLPVHSKMTVFELKKVIRSQTKGLVKNQKLFFDGNDMQIHGWTLSLYGIENLPGVTHRIQLKVFHDELIETLPLKHIHAAIGEKYLSPKWHVDLRSVTSDGKTRLRGGRAYNRPLGCMRFGIQVLGKYNRGKHNTWIGLKGVERVRTNTHGEWPVAYHGTNEQSVLSILEEGFRLDKGIRFAYGHGIYCTPDPLTALAYAFKSVYQGEELQLIIQCRVDPAKMRVVAQPSETGLGEYWLVPSGRDIRPYAVCAYEKQPILAQPLTSVQNINYQQLNGIIGNNGATAQSASSNGNIHSGIAPRMSALSAALNSANLQARASNYSNIHPGVPRANTLNPISNSRNPLASQATSPSVSSSTIHKSIHNANSNSLIRSTVTRVTSHKSTSNNAPNSSLNYGSSAASQTSYSTLTGATLPIHWQGTSYQSISNSSNTNTSNANLRSTTARVPPQSIYQQQRIPDCSDSNNSS